jgi:hypothetical protein
MFPNGLANKVLREERVSALFTAGGFTDKKSAYVIDITDT